MEPSGAASRPGSRALLPFAFAAAAFLVPALCGAQPADGERRHPAAGMFLVASRGLQDPNFARTAVLLLDCDWYGAVGLIVNRPTERTLAEVMPELPGLERHPLHFGGPVAVRRLLFLFRAEQPRDESRKVLEGVCLGSDELLLKRIIAEGESDFRLYAGHAGWAPGQLDYELARGDWLLAPAEKAYIFSREAEKVWPELIERVDLRLAGLPVR
jgi:putative transcriptional regulator